MTSTQISRTAQSPTTKYKTANYMQKNMVDQAYRMFLGSADSTIGRLAYEITMEEGLLRPEPLLFNDTSVLGQKMKEMARRREITTKDYLARLVIRCGCQHPHILLRLLTNRMVWSLL